MARKPAKEQISWNEELRTVIFQTMFDEFGCADDWDDELPPNNNSQWNICQDKILHKLRSILDPNNTGKPGITKVKIKQQWSWAITTQESVKPNHRATLDPCKELAVKIGLIRKGGPRDFRYKDRPEVK